MALTYTMRIDRLDKINSGELVDVVLRVLWTRIGTDENNVWASFQAITILDKSKINSESFTSYSDLTEAKVIEWIMADPQFEQSESIILQRIKDQEIKLVMPQDFPWVPPVITTEIPAILTPDYRNYGANAVPGTP